MLALTRKENERLLFPTLGVSVAVVRIQGNRVRIGVDAPADIPVLREEIADLKGIEFTPDPSASEARLIAMTKLLGEKLHATAGKLNRLHEHLQDDPDGQGQVLNIYRELQDLERGIHEPETTEAETPHALLINRNANERELLASCLRFGGFEVAAAPNTGAAFDYLSLHACPDFALIDTADATSEFTEQLRSNQACSQMKLFGIGEPHAACTDGSFPRPIDAEILVGELTREYADRTAV
ncbi:MAG: carbon storage regulator [Planctomycetaceae bacterium]|nr:carbon storage regulator [Planctomycetaceae bacterium]